MKDVFNQVLETKPTILTLCRVFKLNKTVAKKIICYTVLATSYLQTVSGYWHTDSVSSQGTIKLSIVGLS